MTISGNITIGSGNDGKKYAIIASGDLTSTSGELNEANLYGSSGDNTVSLSNTKNAYINLGGGADTGTFDNGQNLKIISGPGDTININNSSNTAIVANGGTINLDSKSSGTSIAIGNTSGTTTINGAKNTEVEFYINDPSIKDSSGLTFTENGNPKYTTVTYTDVSGNTHSLQINGVTSSQVKDDFSFNSTATQNIFYPDSGNSVNSASFDGLSKVNIFTLSGDDTVTLTNSSGVLVNPGAGADTVISTGGQGNTILAYGGDTVTIGDKNSTVFLGNGSNTVILDSNHQNATLYVDPEASGTTTVTGYKSGDVIQVGGTRLSPDDLAARTEYTKEGGKNIATLTYTDNSGNSHTVRVEGLGKNDKLSYQTGDLEVPYNDGYSGSITHANLASGQTGSYTDSRDFSVNGSSGDETFNFTRGGNNYAYGGAGNDTFNVSSGQSNVLSGGDGSNTYNITSGDSNRVIVGSSDTINLGPDSTNNIIALNSSSGSATITGFNPDSDHILIDDGRIQSYQDFTNSGGTSTYNSETQTTTISYTDSSGNAHNITVNGKVDQSNFAYGDATPDQTVTTTQDTGSDHHHNKFSDDMTTIGLGILSAGIFSVGMASFSFYNQKNKFKKEINNAVQDFYGRNPSPTTQQLEGLVDSFGDKIKNFNDQGKNTFAIAGAITGFGGASTVFAVTGAVAMIGLTGPLGIVAAIVGAVIVAGVTGLMGLSAGSGITGNAADLIVTEALNSPDNKKGPNQRRLDDERKEKEENRMKYIGR